MAFIPLYQLFTTKADRLAVYKWIKYGTKSKKQYDLLNDLAQVVKDDPDYTEEVTEVQGDGSSDKSAELAKQSGIDLLTIKQFIFCDLRASSTSASATNAEPFMCKTVEEIDALGKKTFGALWGSENSKAEKTYLVDYKNSDLVRVMGEYKLPGIVSPLVYEEMFGTITDYAGFGICTMFACLATGHSLCNDIKTFDLKGYLNNSPDRVKDEDTEKRLEEGFYFNLLYYRAQKSLGESLRTTMSQISEMMRMIPWHILKNATPDLWDAYRNVLLCCTHYFWETLVSGMPDDAKMSKFIVDEVWFRYLQNDWKHLVITDECKPAEDYYGKGWLCVVADMDMYAEIVEASGKKPFEYVPIYFAYDSYDRLYDIEDLPWGFDRIKNLDVLSYTSALYRAMWKWEKGHWGSMEFVSKNASFKRKPKMLITNSCLVSVLIKCGAELYFAFRDENSDCDPLVLYVDSEKDKKFVEKCAESVGVDLNGNKNSVVLVKAKAKPEFNELDSSLDTISSKELLSEAVRCYIFLLMMSSSDKYNCQCHTVDDGLHYSWGDIESAGYSCFIDKCKIYTNESKPTGKTVFFAKDKMPYTMYARDTFEIPRVLVPCDCLAFNLSERKREFYNRDCSLTSDVSAVVFPFTKAVAFTRVTTRVTYYNGGSETEEESGDCRVLPLPFLVKEGIGEVMRWSEIPELIPEWFEAWSVVDALSQTTLMEYASEICGVDLRRI